MHVEISTQCIRSAEKMLLELKLEQKSLCMDSALIESDPNLDRQPYYNTHVYPVTLSKYTNDTKMYKKKTFLFTFYYLI